MADRLIIDADVLIDFFRNRPEASSFMDGLSMPPFVSVITVAELFAGVQEGAERKSIEKFFARSAIIDLDEQTCTSAGLMLRQYRKCHGTGLADALVAATAGTIGARVVTLNAKHFPMLPDLLVPYSRS